VHARKYRLIGCTCPWLNLNVIHYSLREFTWLDGRVNISGHPDP
jgi:hypothetical protein